MRLKHTAAYDRIYGVKKAVKITVITLTAIILAVVIALPVAVPPLVERFIAEKISAFGLVPDVKMCLYYGWRNGPGINGTLRVAVADTPWCVRARFGASCCEWSASIRMDDTPFNETDPTISTLLKQVHLPAVSNLTFSGSVSFEGSAERTFHMPVPVWNARASIRNLNATATVEEKDYEIAELSLSPAASGIANHLDIQPLFLKVRSVQASGFTLSDLHASIHASEKALLVTEASAGICGGKVSVFSLFLDPKTFNTGFTLFVDDVGAGEVLAHFKKFKGEATGKLHGKIRLFVREGGKTLRLSDAFLYSTPGEIGKLRMQDATPVTDNLVLAGLDEATRANVANALTDLDYSVLKLNLKRGEGKTARLSVALNGNATRGKTTVPVDLTLNFNGELEQIINTGLGYSRLLKGKQ